MGILVPFFRFLGFSTCILFFTFRFFLFTPFCATKTSHTCRYRMHLFSCFVICGYKLVAYSWFQDPCFGMCDHKLVAYLWFQDPFFGVCDHKSVACLWFQDSLFVMCDHKLVAYLWFQDPFSVPLGCNFILTREMYTVACKT